MQKRKITTIEEFVSALNDFFQTKAQGSLVTLDFFLKERLTNEVPEYEYNVDPTIYSQYNVHEHIDFLLEKMFPEQIEHFVLVYDPRRTHEVYKFEFRQTPEQNKAVGELIDFGKQKDFNVIVPEILEEMAKTFRERNKVYGSNYKMVGKMMAVLFPDGVPPSLLHSDQFHLFELILVKLSRFAISKLQHKDSIHDSAVYCAMIEGILKQEECPF